MEIYRHPVFDMACEQFDLVADFLKLPQVERERVKFPKRAFIVAVPMRMAALSLGIKRVFEAKRQRGLFH